MSKRVVVDCLTREQEAAYKALCREFRGDAQAARAVFAAGLQALKRAPAPPAPPVVVLLDEEPDA